MSVTGERDGEPTKAGVALLDVISGLYAAVGVLAALRERDVTGHGRHVSVSLFDASVAAMVNQAANYLIGGVVPERMGTEHPNIVPYQSFHANDRPFILAAGNDRLFARTCSVVGHPEWADDPRFATNEARVVHRDELIPLLEEAFARRRMREWLALLEEAAVPCAPIMAMDEVFASPDGADLIEQVDDPVRGLLRLVANPIRFDGVAPATRTPPPLLGEHDAEVRRDIESRSVTAADRWREQLAAWAIPDEIVANAPESPWGFATECFRRRGEAAPDPEPTPTTRRALEALPEGGTVLDVGVGGGATSLPLAGRAGSIVGIDQQADMLDGFLANAAAAGVEARAVTGTWPDAAADVEPADVVVAGHVFYNIPELEPFARALDAHARRRVVLELTGAASARLDARPVAPIPRSRTARRADGGRRRAVLGDLGLAADRDERVVAGGLGSGGFARREDAIHSIRKRLCLPADRDPEIAEALGDRLRELDGLWDVGPGGTDGRHAVVGPVGEGLSPRRREGRTSWTTSRCHGPARRRADDRCARAPCRPASPATSGSAGRRRTRRSRGRSSDRSRPATAAAPSRLPGSARDRELEAPDLRLRDREVASQLAVQPRAIRYRRSRPRRPR